MQLITTTPIIIIDVFVLPVAVAAVVGAKAIAYTR